mmetsp:Transcript_1584/g.3093  ORF Transcript_1584/g.3093 Transcript_1584/m.3093 type:complete len:265 (+) Transcript_1584:537-1331(+)
MHHSRILVAGRTGMGAARFLHFAIPPCAGNVVQRHIWQYRKCYNQQRQCTDIVSIPRSRDGNERRICNRNGFGSSLPSVNVARVHRVGYIPGQSHGERSPTGVDIARTRICSKHQTAAHRGHPLINDASIDFGRRRFLPRSTLLSRPGTGIRPRHCRNERLHAIAIPQNELLARKFHLPPPPKRQHHRNSAVRHFQHFGIPRSTEVGVVAGAVQLSLRVSVGTAAAIGGGGGVAHDEAGVSESATQFVAQYVKSSGRIGRHGQR